jgi:hypothetical protein
MLKFYNNKNQTGMENESSGDFLHLFTGAYCANGSLLFVCLLTKKVIPSQRDETHKMHKTDWPICGDLLECPTEY